MEVDSSFGGASGDQILDEKADQNLEGQGNRQAVTTRRPHSIDVKRVRWNVQHISSEDGKGWGHKRGDSLNRNRKYPDLKVNQGNFLFFLCTFHGIFD